MPLEPRTESNAATLAAQRFVLPVQGMSCASCVAHVERALAAVPGVQRVAVNLATESAAIEAHAVDAKRLVAAVDEPLPMAGHERDDIAVVTATGSDSVSSPVSTPPGVGLDMAWARWDDLCERSASVAAMFAKYKPEILVFRCEAGCGDCAFEISSRWLVAADSLGASLVIYAPPIPNRSRGWAAITGRHIRRGLVEGLTPAGLLCTLRILAGIPWEKRLAAGVPAAGALDFDPFDSGSLPR